jgi:DNA repair exonuclease SbcCD ATPase subunit
MPDRESLAAQLARDIKRLEALKTLKARSEGEMERIESDLTKLQNEANARFGTDDPDSLENLAQKILTEADENIQRFKGEIDAIHQDLAEMGINMGG